MAYLNDGPCHVMSLHEGVPPLWPEAKDGYRVTIHNGRTTKEYEFRDGK